MRARRVAYKVMAKFRAHHNNVTMREPRSMAELKL
jgi:hypothetical protein